MLIGRASDCHYIQDAFKRKIIRLTRDLNRIYNQRNMTTYKLYLESGPQKKRTLVHVPELLGLNYFGATTDAALAKSRDAIQFYRDWLRAHGEAIESDAIEFQVAEHITQGDFIGHGSPACLFAPDKKPLTPRALEKHLRHLAWQRADLLKLVAPLSPGELRHKPAGKRAILEILEHIQAAERAYPATLKPMPRLPKTHDIFEKLELTRRDVIGFFSTLSAGERHALIIKGNYQRTAMRALRRVLEHEWEHLQEIRRRVNP
ncbi:MAG: type II toxin-antitoxin system HicB family antitoxin [Chloroflexi bacterium]|nr:type II toxin-antitoxin system HicB family antitoxin [Chloroflexota bacterium]